MNPSMMHTNPRSWPAMVLCLVGCVVPAFTQRAVAAGAEQPWWVDAGVGTASVNSRMPAPSAGRGAVAASAEFGYRLTPNFGLGLEYGVVAPVDGCADWPCAGTVSSFAPNFTRLFAFGELRPGDGGWRLRAGGGLSRFCYSRSWSETGWSWADTLYLLLDDDAGDYAHSGTGAYHCSGHVKALGGAVSLGYDWSMKGDGPLFVGLRLTAEAANFRDAPGIGLPAFKHRAVMLSLHVGIN